MQGQSRTIPTLQRNGREKKVISEIKGVEKGTTGLGTGGEQTLQGGRPKVAHGRKSVESSEKA